MLKSRRNARILAVFSRRFSETPSNPRLSPSWMVQLFKENLGFSSQRRENNEKPQPDYSFLAKNLENMASINQETFTKHLREIHKEIQQSLEQSFENSSIKALMSSVPSAFLCELAIENFVGSINSPKNDFLMGLCLEFAEKNAQDADSRALVSYTRVYLRKLEAIQAGDSEAFKENNEKLLSLYEQANPLATHIIAKEIYKVALGILSGKEKKSKKAMISKAFELFNQAAEKGSWLSFYYLGEMAQNGDIPGGVDLRYAFDCYIIAAAHESALAFFRLAQFYKEGIIEEKNKELEFYYTKKAAELGLLEAQHNLGCMYLEGRVCEYDSLKAISWFKHAGAHGFVHSNYNAAKMFLEGSEDGKVARNYLAALQLLEDVKKSEKINVDKLMEETVELLKRGNKK